MSTQTIIVERRGRVGVIRLNRPQAPHDRIEVAANCREFT